MKKLTSLLLIGLLLLSNINAIRIKKNYLELSSKKGILSDILKNNIEVEKEQNDEYTKLIFKIYKDKALKDKTNQDVNQLAKTIAEYLIGEEEKVKQQIAQKPEEKQLPEQLNKLFKMQLINYKI